MGNVCISPDELCGCVRMGGLYHIIGVPVYEPESDGQLHMVISTSIEVCCDTDNAKCILQWET